MANINKLLIYSKENLVIEIKFMCIIVNFKRNIILQ